MFPLCNEIPREYGIHATCGQSQLMILLADECTGPAAAACLRSKGHEVFSVFEEDRRMDDEGIIQRASQESWILVTKGKDCGGKVKEHRDEIEDVWGKHFSN